MKRVLLVLTAIMLVFAVVGCDNGSTGSPPAAKGTTYEGKDKNGTTFKLVVTDAKVAAKDPYTLTIGAGGASLKSTGTIVSASASSIALSNGSNVIVTVSGATISSITGTIGLDGGGTFTPDFTTLLVDPFDEAVGIMSGIDVQGDGASLETTDNGLVIGLGSNRGGSSLFILDLPNYQTTGGADGKKVITITYICKLIAGEAKVTVKDGAWSDPPNPGSFNIYPTLTTGEEAKAEIPESIYTKGRSKISFQCNDQNNAAEFYIKILSVTMEEPKKD